MKTEYDFIVNPKARSGMGEMIWKALEPELKKQKIDYRVHMTDKRKSAEKIAEAVTSDGKEHTLVVLGGDGTVNEAVNEMCIRDREYSSYAGQRVYFPDQRDISREFRRRGRPVCGI